MFWIYQLYGELVAHRDYFLPYNYSARHGAWDWRHLINMDAIEFDTVYLIVTT